MKMVSGTIKLLTDGSLAAENKVSRGTAENMEKTKLKGEEMVSQKLIEINEIKFNVVEQFNKKLVEALAASIESVGLLNPIIVTPELQLVAGRLRLEAYKFIGLKTIPATIVSLDEMHQRMATIDENLIRKRLTKLEQAQQYSERKKIYEALYPETRRGVAGALARHNGGGATDKLSFAADVASKTGQSERNVNRVLAIYDNLYPEVRHLVENSAIADNFSELRQLSDCEFDEQIELAELIFAGKAKSVAEASGLVNEPFLFKNTDKGKFQKSVKMAEKALKQLIDDGAVQNLVDGIKEEHYVFFKDKLMADLQSLKDLQERVQVAIRIFETGIRSLETNTFVSRDNNQELALAE